MNIHYKISDNEQFFEEQGDAEDHARNMARQTGETIFVYQAIKSFTTEVKETDLTRKEAEEYSKATDEIYAGSLSFMPNYCGSCVTPCPPSVTCNAKHISKK